MRTARPRRVVGGQAGQTAVEYIGMLLVAATVVALVAASGVAAQVTAAIDTAICIVSSGEQTDCARPADAVAGATPRAPDADGDGLSDRRERRLGTLPGKADSDSDGIVDPDELRRGSDPTEADSDGDAIADGEEIRLTGQTGDTFDPSKRDTDGDGLSDAEERAAGTPPDSADADGDGHGGLTDGLTDAQEILRHGTDPTKIDTDGDGKSDGNEVNAGSNPLADERALGQKIKPLLEDVALGDLPTPAAVGMLLKKIPGLGKQLRRLLGSTNDAAKALRKNLTQGAERRNRVLDARRKNVQSKTPGAAGLERQPLEIDDAQFGRKIASHAADYGLDPSSAADRAKLRKIVEDIGTNPERVVKGSFRGQGPAGARGPVSFRIKGGDVVVTSPTGRFVTILRGGVKNPSVKRALRE